MTNIYLDGASMHQNDITFGSNCETAPSTPQRENKIEFNKPDIDKLKFDLDQMKAAYTGRVVAHLNEIFKQFFEKYYVVESVQWTQYTDYFNDGETCHFHVHEATLCLRKDPAESVHVIGAPSPEDDDIYDGEVGEWDLKNRPEFKELNVDFSNLQDLLFQSKEQLEHSFGDHKEVIVNRQGITIQEHEDHD